MVVPRGTTTSVAPVCPVSRFDTPAAQPGVGVPSIPLANDLPSAINAVNQLVTRSNAQAKIRWLEKYRITQIVRIENPNDSSQWVDVLQIVKLVMQDQITGDLWAWQIDGVATSA